MSTRKITKCILSFGVEYILNVQHFAAYLPSEIARQPEKTCQARKRTLAKSKPIWTGMMAY